MTVRKYALLLGAAFAAVLVLLVFNFRHTYAWYQRNSSAERRVSTLNPLRVELSTEKETYKLGEPIRVTVTLRNAGSQPVWVRTGIIVARWPGAFEVKVFDEEGKQLPGGTALVHGPLRPPENVDLFEYVRQTRDIFMPGDFVGFSRSLEDLGFVMEKPGRYRIQATYGDVDLKELIDPRQVAEAQKKAGLPIWSGYLVSPSVWIQVLGQSNVDKTR